MERPVARHKESELKTKIRWHGGQRFEGEVDGAPIVLDGESATEAGPMQVVLGALAGCMGIDIAMILEKGRVELSDLEVEVEGQRAEDPPRCFIGYTMVVKVTAKEPSDRLREKVERAVALSKEKYCSVWHTLDRHVAFEVAVEIAGQRG